MSLSSAPPLAISGFVTIALGLIVLILAYIQGTRKNYKTHSKLMKVATALNAAFLIQYITRAVILRQETHFPGPDNIKFFVYYPILIIHITGAVITIYLILKHVIEASKNQKQQNSGIPYFESDYKPRHRSFGLLVFRLWVITYSGGIIIFLLLYILF